MRLPLRRTLRSRPCARFSNGWYAAVEDANGNGALELLIDPATGRIWLGEPGPAIMWNIEYVILDGRFGGVMMAACPLPPNDRDVSAEEAREIVGA